MKFLQALTSTVLVATSLVAPVINPPKAEAHLSSYRTVCLDAVVYAPTSNIRAYPSLSAPVTYRVTKVRSLVVADASYMGAFYKVLNDEYRGGYIHMSQVSVNQCVNIW
jgi:hypothetical protein